ncbi:MAG TPA: aldolase/citrate lyase family protein [Gemmatimonas sp.]|uniref:aldolase/citrate lyase family protein n=1 Tax=Gemmatimonas sp. TaxID=1962908 RepID=UPI002ED7E213
MRPCWMLAAAAAVSLSALPGTASAQARLNPVIDLLAAKKPVFGLYAPANPRARPGQPAPTGPVKSMTELGQEALAYKKLDYIFEGTMEYNFDQSFPAFQEFAKALDAGGSLQKGKAPRFTHPVFVKTPEIAPDPAVASARIGKQLNEGVSGIMFVDVQSAEELKKGVAALRFKSKGGTRSDDVGGAPARWGMTEKEYKERADLWPLNPKGELVTFTIVESKEGLAKVREIAAVPGVGVLFPGAGTLRGVFTTTDASGQRKFDEAAWEASIQSVLAACKEFKVPCGYPAGAADIEMRMKQGFSVFVIGWGEPGFKAVDLGRAAGGR